jgi:hypothetical protein
MPVLSRRSANNRLTGSYLKRADSSNERPSLHRSAPLSCCAHSRERHFVLILRHI